MMRKTILCLALAAGSMTATVCSAQDTPGTPAAQTRAQAIAQADMRFAQIDSDHDGLVSATEMQAYRSALRDRRIARGGDGPVPPTGGAQPRSAGHDGIGRRIDPDGSGSVTRAEFSARAAARFDRIDANHDGVVDSAERADRAEMRDVDRRDRPSTPAPAPAQ